MHLSLCLLLTASLLNGVSAFYPYSLDAKTPADSSALNNLERRLARQSQDSEDSSSASGGPFTLEVKRSLIRRDNNYTVIIADTPSTPNSVGLDQDGHDYAYFASVKLGSAGQEMWMMLDTGGTGTWVYGMDCKADACLMHRSFNETASQTFSKTDTSFAVWYGSGNVTVTLGTDTLSIADLNVPMSFGLAYNATDDLLSYPNDGIIGLGRSNDISFGTSTFMDVVAQNNMLKSNIVAFDISRASEGGKDGEVTFGGVDESRFSGEIAYTSVSESSVKWSIPLDDASVGGKPCNFSNKHAVIDTATSYVLLPPDDAKAIHALIPGASSSGPNFQLPCDTTATLQFVFSGISYNIPPDDYVKRVSDGNCTSAIVGQQYADNENQWLVGDVFLKNVYSIFDFDNNRIGFASLPTPPEAKAAQSSQSSQSSQPTKDSAGFHVTPSIWWPAVAILSILCS